MIVDRITQCGYDAIACVDVVILDRSCHSYLEIGYQGSNKHGLQKCIMSPLRYPASNRDPDCARSSLIPLIQL